MENRPFTHHAFECFLGEEALMGSRCTACGALSVPPRAICADCHGGDMTWEPMQGTGRLAAFTCIAIGPPAMAEEGYGRDNPYCCGVVELDEKTRVVARIEGVDTSAPQTIRIGTPMRAAYLHRGEGEQRRTVLAFRPR